MGGGGERQVAHKPAFSARANVLTVGPCFLAVQVPSERYLFMKASRLCLRVCTLRWLAASHAEVLAHMCNHMSTLSCMIPTTHPPQMTYTEDTPDEYEPPMFGPAADGGVGCFSRMPFVMWVLPGWALRWHALCKAAEPQRQNPLIFS